MNNELKISVMDLEELSKQGEYSSAENMERAIKDVNTAFKDPDFAKKHPELVGQIVMASAIDYFGTLHHIDMEKLIGVVSELIELLKKQND